MLWTIQICIYKLLCTGSSAVHTSHFFEYYHYIFDILWKYRTYFQISECSTFQFSHSVWNLVKCLGPVCNLQTIMHLNICLIVEAAVTTTTDLVVVVVILYALR
jgi:hypothetical protein